MPSYLEVGMQLEEQVVTQLQAQLCCLLHHLHRWQLEQVCEVANGAPCAHTGASTRAPTQEPARS